MFFVFPCRCQIHFLIFEMSRVDVDAILFNFRSMQKLLSKNERNIAIIQNLIAFERTCKSERVKRIPDKNSSLTSIWPLRFLLFKMYLQNSLPVKHVTRLKMLNLFLEFSPRISLRNENVMRKTIV